MKRKKLSINTTFNFEEPLYEPRSELVEMSDKQCRGFMNVCLLIVRCRAVHVKICAHKDQAQVHH